MTIKEDSEKENIAIDVALKFFEDCSCQRTKKPEHTSTVPKSSKKESIETEITVYIKLFKQENDES